MRDEDAGSHDPSRLLQQGKTALHGFSTVWRGKSMQRVFDPLIRHGTHEVQCRSRRLSLVFVDFPAKAGRTSDGRDGRTNDR
jgi:hypothetical protein